MGEPLIATPCLQGQGSLPLLCQPSFAARSRCSLGLRHAYPAREIEAAVAERIAEALDDPIALTASAGFTLHSSELGQTIALAAELAERVRAKDYGSVRNLVSRVQATPREAGIELATDALARALKLERVDNPNDAISLVAKVRLTRTGRAVRKVHSSGTPATAGKADPGLIALLVTARRRWGRISAGEIDIATLSREEKISDPMFPASSASTFCRPASSTRSSAAPSRPS